MPTGLPPPPELSPCALRGGSAPLLLDSSFIPSASDSLCGTLPGSLPGACTASIFTSLCLDLQRAARSQTSTAPPQKNTVLPHVGYLLDDLKSWVPQILHFAPFLHTEGFGFTGKPHGPAPHSR